MTKSGPCADDRVWSGGLVGALRFGASITDSYALGRASRKGDNGTTCLRPSGVDQAEPTYAPNIGGLAGEMHSDVTVTDSYWNSTAYECSYQYQEATINAYYLDHRNDKAAARTADFLKTPVVADAAQQCDFSQFRDGSDIEACATYATWSNSDWDFGTDNEFPFLRHIRYGTDKDDPDCGYGRLPDCGSLLAGQKPTRTATPIATRPLPEFSDPPADITAKNPAAVAWPMLYVGFGGRAAADFNATADISGCSMLIGDVTCNSNSVTGNTIGYAVDRLTLSMSNGAGYIFNLIPVSVLPTNPTPPVQPSQSVSGGITSLGVDTSNSQIGNLGWKIVPQLSNTASVYDLYYIADVGPYVYLVGNVLSVGLFGYYTFNKNFKLNPPVFDEDITNYALGFQNIRTAELATLSVAYIFNVAEDHTFINCSAGGTKAQPFCIGNTLTHGFLGPDPFTLTFSLETTVAGETIIKGPYVVDVYSIVDGEAYGTEPSAPPSAGELEAVVRSTINENSPSILGDAAITLGEGDTLKLDARRSSLIEENFPYSSQPLLYRWHQISGPELLPREGAEPTLTLKVRDDLVAEDVSEADVVLALELRARDDLSVPPVVKEIPLRISKTQSLGTVTMTWIQDALVAEVADADGVPDNVDYNWYINIDRDTKEPVSIQKGFRSAYFPPPAQRSAGLKVEISYIDKQGYTNVLRDTAPAYAASTQVDADGDGLIDIVYLEQLSNIRHSPAGENYKTASGDAGDSTGCPTPDGETQPQCHGYELVRDLDFNDDTSYSAIANKAVWTGSGWGGIPSFHGTFEGNGFTISNLKVRNNCNCGSSDNCESNKIADCGNGLFRRLLAADSNSPAAMISGVRLANVDIRADVRIGALVGYMESYAAKIIDSHVVGGSVTGVGEEAAPTSWSRELGCLVGSLGSNGEISDSSANCEIRGTWRIGGLVGSNAGTIRHSHASGDVRGRVDWIGGLVGFNDGGIIEHSRASGRVTSSGLNNLDAHEVGGLVGRSEGGHIRYGRAGGAVSGDSEIGGLVGIAEGTDISDSRASGVVAAADEPQTNVGGLVGKATDLEINNSRADGGVSGTASIGGLVGAGDSLEINDSHAGGGVSGTTSIGGLVGSGNTIDINDSHAGGRVSGQADIGGLVGSGTTLDINGSRSSGDVQAVGNNAGGLVGSGNTLNINGSRSSGDIQATDNVGGLVGNARRTDISNSHAVGTIRGRDKVGGLVGEAEDGQINDSYAAAAIHGRNYAGGLGGQISGADNRYVINHSYAIGAVEGSGGLLGGLVGEATSVDISNSHAAGNVVAIKISGSQNFIGGLAGSIRNVNIDNSYAIGDVDWRLIRDGTILRGYFKQRVGGLVGRMDYWDRGTNYFNTIENSYAIGTVKGQLQVGGLVGAIDLGIRDLGTIISNSYAVGRTFARGAFEFNPEEDGGLVGVINEDFGSRSFAIEQSYWSVDGTGQDDSFNSTTKTNYVGFASALLRAAEPTTTADNQPYYRWSREHWDFGTAEQYPALRYNDATCATDTPSPLCGTLLIRQHLGLKDIVLAQDRGTPARLVPSFSPDVKDYDVTVDIETDQLEITAVAGDADAQVAVGESVLAKGAASATVSPDFSMTPAADAIIRVSHPHILAGEAPVEYTLRVTNRFPYSNIAELRVTDADGTMFGINADAVIDEGVDVALVADFTDADDDAVSYSITLSECRRSGGARQRVSATASPKYRLRCRPIYLPRSKPMRLYRGRQRR